MVLSWLQYMYVACFLFRELHDPEPRRAVSIGRTGETSPHSTELVVKGEPAAVVAMLALSHCPRNFLGPGFVVLTCDPFFATCNYGVLITQNIPPPLSLLPNIVVSALLGSQCSDFWCLQKLNFLWSGKSDEEEEHVEPSQRGDIVGARLPTLSVPADCGHRLH